MKTERETINDLIDILIKKRKELDLTPKQLAEKSGITMLKKYEKEKYVKSSQHLFYWAKALGLKLTVRKAIQDE